MKKFQVTIVLLFIFAILAAAVASGGEAGRVYSTDILAEVNGFPIPSYNIGGKTCICVDDLANFGFTVSKNGNAVALVSPTSAKQLVGTGDVRRGRVGGAVGTFSESGARLTVNGRSTAAYDIGGKLCVCIEELGTAVGGDPYYDRLYHDGWSERYMRYEWNAETRTISLLLLLIDNVYPPDTRPADDYVS